MSAVPFSCVIDANILLKTVSVEDYSEEILTFFQELTPGMELHAPILTQLEYANVLRTRILVSNTQLSRHGRICRIYNNYR